MEYHLAQINVAQAKATMDSQVMSGFVDRLDEINALADQSPGFVWRLQGYGGNSTTIQAFDDPNLIVNMSVWESLKALGNYVYKSTHVDLVRQKGDWFHKIFKPYQCLWWVEKGYIPSVQEGKERLEYLQTNGPSRYAFTFAKPFPATDIVSA